MSIPGDTRAVLLVCESESWQAAELTIATLVQMPQHAHVHVHVMFLDPRSADHSSDVLDAILKAQCCLLEAGADDVFVKDSNDLELAIAMSAVRVAASRSREASQKHVLDGHKGLISTLQHSMWGQARMCLPSLPPVDASCPRELQPGVTVGECKLLTAIGQGRHGPVYVAKNLRLDRHEAVKVVLKRRIYHLNEIQGNLREVQMLRRLQHRNIVQCHGMVHTRDFLLIHMEMAGSNNLFQFMKQRGGRRFAEQQARVFASQVAQAVDHCHLNGVAHCDLKPENICVSLDGSHAKIVDFGLAVDTSARKTGIVGTMPFIAPEVVGAADYDPAPLDIWAFGGVVLELLCGLHKLSRMMNWNKHEAPCQRIQQELTYFFSQPEALRQALQEDGVSPKGPLMSLLRGMFEVSPENRWTSSQLTTSKWLLN
jgi:tRNA A-37 threonylcarbamoyl transferase component Bud32